MAFRYMVTAIIANQEYANEYVAWLKGGHVQDVVNRGGALTGEVIALDSTDGRIHVQSLYMFPSRSAFESYQTGAAVELKAEGKRLFVDTNKVAEWQRATGEVNYVYNSAISVGGHGDTVFRKTEWPELLGLEYCCIFELC
jgi:hypothetical protein